MARLSFGKIFDSKPKMEVPATAISGPYKYVWRISDNKRFDHQPGDLYQSADGEKIPLYQVQRIRWKHIEGEGYILSNNPLLPLQVPYEKTATPLTRRVIVLLAQLGR